MSNWITAQQAGSILDVDPETVRNWIRQRLVGEQTRIRYVKVDGGRYFVSLKEIQSIAKEARERF